MIAYFESFGCKVNQYETEIIKSDFRLKGYEITADPAAADVAVINSCTVTASGDSKCLYSCLLYTSSDKLGPMVYGTDQNEVFLGRDFNSSKNYSENVAAEIDAEMREIIEEGYERAKDLLEQNMDQLHLLAKYLMKYEKIDDVDFEKLMKGELDESVLNDDEDSDNESEEGNTEENKEK